MRVKDLIEALEEMDQNAEVHFQYNYGDYWRTQVAPTVDSVAGGVVAYSDYPNMHKVVNEDREYEDEDEEEERKFVQQVVILS